MVNKSDGPSRFDPGIVRAACGDGEATAIRNLSVAVIAALEGRAKAKAKNPASYPISQGHIPDSEAKNYAYRMLKALERVQRPPPHDLVRLFQAIFEQDKKPGKTVRKHVEREEARRYVKKNPNASLSDIAHAVGVNRSTVSRWKNSKQI